MKQEYITEYDRYKAMFESIEAKCIKENLINDISISRTYRVDTLEVLLNVRSNSTLIKLYELEEKSNVENANQIVYYKNQGLIVLHLASMPGKAGIEYTKSGEIYIYNWTGRYSNNILPMDLYKERELSFIAKKSIKEIYDEGLTKMTDILRHAEIGTDGKTGRTYENAVNLIQTALKIAEIE